CRDLHLSPLTISSRPLCESPIGPTLHPLAVAELIDDGGDDDHGANHHELSIGGHTKQIEGVREQGESDDTNGHAPQAALPTPQGPPADHHCGYRLQLTADTQIRLPGADT